MLHIVVTARFVALLGLLTALNAGAAAPTWVQKNVTIADPVAGGYLFQPTNVVRICRVDVGPEKYTGYVEPRNRDRRNLCIYSQQGISFTSDKYTILAGANSSKLKWVASGQPLEGTILTGGTEGIGAGKKNRGICRFEVDKGIFLPGRLVDSKCFVVAEKENQKREKILSEVSSSVYEVLTDLERNPDVVEIVATQATVLTPVKPPPVEAVAQGSKKALTAKDVDQTLKYGDKMSLLGAGVPITVLREGGLTVRNFLKPGFIGANDQKTLKLLKDSGFVASDFKDFAASDVPHLLTVFTVKELTFGGMLQVIILEGCTPIKTLKNAGWKIIEIMQNSATRPTKPIHRCDYDLNEIIKNYTLKEIYAESYPGWALAKFFSYAELVAVGYKLADFTGFPIVNKDYFKTGGVSLSQLKAAGFKPEQLIKVGFEVSELKTVGYTISSLYNFGDVSNFINGAHPEELRKGGFSITDFDKAIGTKAMRAAGFELKDWLVLLRSGYFDSSWENVVQSMAVQFSPKEIKDAGVTAAEFHKWASLGGTDDDDLAKRKQSGQAHQSEKFNHKLDRLMRKQYKIDGLKLLGYTNAEIRKIPVANFRSKLNAKFETMNEWCKTLRDIGFSEQELAKGLADRPKQDSCVAGNE